LVLLLRSLYQHNGIPCKVELNKLSYIQFLHTLPNIFVTKCIIKQNNQAFILILVIEKNVKFKDLMFKLNIFRYVFHPLVIFVNLKM